MAARRTVEADYLVVGCGAAGMAFTDSLIGASRAEVVMFDRRHAPGGHRNEAYPFVRLHQPSAYYGVNSLALGSETIDRYETRIAVGGHRRTTPHRAPEAGFATGAALSVALRRDG
jgi:cation diffusion facilitator CzcD-associated flavoprotein CzcO